MKVSPLTLLNNQPAFWASAKELHLQWRDLWPFLAFIVTACGIYGGVLAGWRSPLLSLYVAIKLPFLFLTTMAIVSIFNWMLASIMGAGLNYRTTIFIVVASMTLASWILLSLAPVALFFQLTGVPHSTIDSSLLYAQRCILITHIAIFSIAGIAGNAMLLKGLRQLLSPRCPPGLLFLSWLTVFAFVGCQLSWILRPFVGNPFLPIVFMRPNCLEANFYEFVFGQLLPYLLSGGKQ
jgi:hypothetical protein